MDENRILTTQELAKYLKLNEKTVIKMAQKGHLPGVKIGNQWRFHSKAIDSYLLRNIMGAPDEDLESVIKTDINIIPLSRLTSVDLIRLNFEGETVDSVLVELADISYEKGLIFSAENLLAELRQREAMLSTAIGGGVAVPHVRHPSSGMFKERRVVIMCSRKGVEYGAPDNKPVHVFFMPCADSESVHVRMLAKISRFLHAPNVVKDFMAAENPEQIIQIFLKFEREQVFSGAKG